MSYEEIILRKNKHLQGKYTDEQILALAKQLDNESDDDFADPSIYPDAPAVKDDEPGTLLN